MTVTSLTLPRASVGSSVEEFAAEADVTVTFTDTEVTLTGALADVTDVAASAVVA